MLMYFYVDMYMYTNKSTNMYTYTYTYTATDSKLGRSDTNFCKNKVKKVLKSFKNDLLSNFNTFFIIWFRLHPSQYFVTVCLIFPEQVFSESCCQTPFLRPIT